MPRFLIAAFASAAPVDVRLPYPLSITDIAQNSTHSLHTTDIPSTVRAAHALLQGADGALRKTEEMEGVLAQIRDQAERYARLRLSAAILRDEMERYRKENQGPVLGRASEIFRVLTLESFDGLTTDFDGKNNPILVGERRGERITLDGMSDGTQDQLFLALRLSGLEHRAKTQEPMPLILDDILVNFDNDRAAACLKILAELSATTQVILFTHHGHILDLAMGSLDNGRYRQHKL